MALSEEQKRRIEANIERLDYLKGTGILSANRKRLAEEVFIFISAGGIGHKALSKLKKTIENQVDAEEIHNKTVFLAIDTDWRELDKCVDREEFHSNEVLKIPYQGAHDSIAPDKILTQLREWVHEELWEITGGAATMSKEFNGTGAGGIRQCGRVLFAQSAVQKDLYAKLSVIPSRLAASRTSKVKVFFLSSIAGGTGSGTILDLTFLTRHFLKGILAQTYNDVTFSGYLFLPSACGNTPADMSQADGKRNAYAALKEIDYYMTLNCRKEHFVMNYGTVDANNVDISDNIFDFCTLVEGVGDGGTFYEDNAETSRQIVADSIMNIICADNAQSADGNDVFLVDSFFSNITTRTQERIRRKSDQVWPRDANYIYSVIGFSSCVVPIDLLTVYVTKKIFDEVFRHFSRAEEADEENAAAFLEACGLELKKLERSYKTLSIKNMIEDIQKQADLEFEAYGPYYMVNLTGEAAELISQAPKDYLHKARDKQNALLSDKEKWKRISSLYEKASSYLGEINNKLYEIYSYVIEVLKELIENNAKLLTDTQEYRSQFGKTFYWSPVDLTPGDRATTAVAEYLDEIMDEEAVQATARKFMEDLKEKKKQWTGWDGSQEQDFVKLNISKEVRDFVAGNLTKCVNTTLEEFLVKAYSGKKDAPVSETDTDTGREVCSRETREAAESVLKRLANGASALASTQGFSLADCYSHVYLTLPENCRWLNQAISSIAHDYKINSNHIYKSSALDRIVFCKLYAGVPAWSLYWTASAEEIYEGPNGEGPGTIGLHMDQGKNGTDWAELPNLYPEKLWSASHRRVCMRESRIIDKICSNMERAKELFILTKDENDPKYYNVALIKKTDTAQELYAAADLDARKKYGLEEVIQILVSKGCLESFKINYINMVMENADDLNENQLEEYYFSLACRTIRRFHGKFKLLDRTVPVIEELKKMNDSRVVLDTELLTSFIGSLKWGFLVFDGRRKYWKSTVGDEMQVGKRLGDKFEQICAHYYGFQAFSAMDGEKLEEIRKEIEKMETGASDEELDHASNAMDKLKKCLILLRNAKETNICPWPEESPFKDANGSAWPMATQNFVEKTGSGELTKSIRDFYTDMINNM